MNNKFVYYNYLPLLASHIIDLPRSNYLSVGITPKHNNPPFHVEDIKRNDIIFVKTDLLGHFFHHYYNQLQVPFYLITGVSDYPIDERFVDILNHEKIIKWFGHNITITHPKCVKLPIAFDENERCRGGPADGESGDQLLLQKLYEQRKTFRSKKNKLLVTHIGNTHSSRKHVTKYFEDKTFADFIGKKSFEDYMEKINEYKFVLCPRGNGEDTHRFWEVMLMGSVPVVERNGLADFFGIFPCIIVDKFADVNGQRLTEFAYDEEKAKNIKTYLFIEDFKVFFKNNTKGKSY